MLNSYWLDTPWLKRLQLLTQKLNICNTNIFSITDIIYVNQSIRKSFIFNRKILELYIMDMYCINKIGKPAFCISIKELKNERDKNIINDIKDNSTLLILSLISSLYGDLNGQEQLEYLLKWSKVNTLIFTSIWEGYRLKSNKSLRNVEIDINKVRFSYLRKLDTINNNNIQINKENNKKVINESIVSILLNH